MDPSIITLRLATISFMISALLATVAVSGCRSGQRTGLTPPPRQSISDKPIPKLSDDFEGKKIAGFWLAGNYGSGRYASDSVKLSSAFARSGKQSVEITVHQGDIDAGGDDSTRVERAELDSGHFALRDRDVWYGFSFLIPVGFPIVADRLVIAQCKQSDVSRPIVAQRYSNGEHTLTIESQGEKKKYQLPEIHIGRWMDMLYHIRYSAGNDGLVEVWADGAKVVTYSGPAADPNAKDAFYNKIGLYRDRLKQPMTIYFDNYTLGPTQP